MGFLGRKDQEPVKTTLDEVLTNPAAFHDRKVTLDGLVVDKVVGNAPVHLMVHQEGSNVRGIVWVYYPGAILAALSEQGQKVSVEGTFYQGGRG